METDVCPVDFLVFKYLTNCLDINKTAGGKKAEKFLEMHEVFGINE